MKKWNVNIERLKELLISFFIQFLENLFQPSSHYLELTALKFEVFPTLFPYISLIRCLVKGERLLWSPTKPREIKTWRSNVVYFSL
jgi:hypothetical protein